MIHYQQYREYKKVMEIITTFQDNLRDNINTYVIVNNPKLVINGRVALLLEIEGYLSDGVIAQELDAKIRIFSESKTSPHDLIEDRKISIHDLELYKEKETREMKEAKGVNNKLVFTPKRINFRKKNDNYYTDVLWEDGTVTVVKLRE